MEFFGKLMRLFGVDKPEMDPIAKLPVELMHSIFRLLDPQSLQNAAQVSRGWLHVCQSDFRLRAIVRRHLRAEKKRLYDLPTVDKHRVTKTTVMKTAALSQVVSIVPAPATYTFGPSGVTSGRIKTQNIGRTSRSKVGAKSMLKFR